MALKGFYNEETLDEMLYNGTITRLEYIYHHSQEMIDEFRDFCQLEKLKEDEQTANRFWDWQLEIEEQSHQDYLG